MKLRERFGNLVVRSATCQLINQNCDKVIAANSHSSRFKLVGTMPEVAQARESVEMTRSSHCF
jgi:hypothetical protein